MKKLLMGIVVCSLASVAFAAPSFDINGGLPIELTPGVPLTVAVNESGSTGIAGMNLNLEIQGILGDFASPVQITGLDIDGAGNVFNGNTTGASITVGVAGFEFLALGSVTTASGTLANSGPGIAAKVTLLAPLGTPNGPAGVITTNSLLAGPSAMLGTTGDPMLGGQGTTQLSIVPEPVTGLLLLAGLPLLRRRRA